MSTNKGSSGGAVVAVLLILVLIVVFLFYSGYIHLPTGSSTNKITPTSVTSYSFSSSINPSSSLNPGQSGQVIVTYENPFAEPVLTNVSFSVNQPAFITETPPYQVFTMPSSMAATASVTFSVACSNSITTPITSTSVFTVSSSGLKQDTNTSIIIYPYTTPSSLIPSPVYSSPFGFLSIVASPLSLETNDQSANKQTLNSSMDIIINPDIYSGNVYTQILPSGANGEISSVTVTIDNSSGAIASAFIYYAGKAYYPTVSGNLLTITIPNVQLSLIPGGLPLTVSAFNSVTHASQNLVGIAVDYNYLYSTPGPTITCNS